MNNSIIDLEHNLIPVVIKMEQVGVKIDIKKLSNVEQQLKQFNNKVVFEISQLTNNNININSSEQLSQFLFDELKLKPQVTNKGKNGYYSVDKVHLSKLVDNHKIIAMLLNYRKTQSLLKFCNQLKRVNTKTNRLHCSLNQIGTATGRFSCSDPNIQNIPNVKLTEEKPDELKILASKFREVFVPKKGCVFVCADYSQIELRVAAQMSQDSFLLKAYNGNLDIHKLTSSEIFKVNYEDVTEQQRSIAKTINFGLIYGKTAFGFAETLTQITGKQHNKQQAEKIINDYFERFSGVKTMLEALVDYADKYGYSKTLFGRTRPIPELSSTTISEREKGKRLAMNSPIQGSAADIIKMAMIACDKAITQQNLKSKMILQIHDELLFEVPNDEIAIMKKLVKDHMENAVSLSIPLEVELKTGINWAVAH